MTRTLPPLAFVRYIDAVADTFNTDFRAIDQVAYSTPFLNNSFRNLSGSGVLQVGAFQGYQAGSRHIRVFLDPSPSSTTVNVDPTVVSTILVDTTLSLTAGTYYTLVHVGGARTGAAVKQHLLVIADATLPAQTAGVQYRVLNAAYVQGAVDVYVRPDGTTPLTGAAAPANLAFGAYTAAYASQAVGPLVIRLTTPGTLTAVGAATGFTLQAGTAGTTLADPIFGSGQAGTIVTAIIFDATPVGTKQAVAYAAPGVVFFPDMQPPRTTSP